MQSKNNRFAPSTPRKPVELYQKIHFNRFLTFAFLFLATACAPREEGDVVLNEQGFYDQPIGWVSPTNLLLLRKVNSLDPKFNCASTGIYMAHVGNGEVVIQDTLLAGLGVCEKLLQIEYSVLNKNGDKALYIGTYNPTSSRGIGILDIRSGEMKSIPHACAKWASGLTWIDDARFALLTSCTSAQGASKLILFTAEGNELKRIPLPSGEEQFFGGTDWSNAVQKFVLSAVLSSDSEHQGRLALTDEAGKVEWLDYFGLSAAWSASGSELAYLSFGEHAGSTSCIEIGLFGTQTSGSEAERANRVCGEFNGPIHWSPDDHYVAFSCLELNSNSSCISVWDIRAGRVMDMQVKTAIR